MGDGTNKKRKRVEEDVGEGSGKPQPKIRAKEVNGSKRDKTSSSDAGKARQQKSQRRSKKALSQAKQDEEPNGDASGSAKKTDEFADGGDYVPISDASAVKKPRKQSAVLNGASTVQREKKPKKSSPRSTRKAARAAKDGNTQSDQKVEGDEVAERNAEGTESNTMTGAPTRFICFVGNLPFTATNEQIKAHFSKLAPKSVRHSTDKKTGKSKGFAFLEFESYDRMKTCLKVYHHSIFDPARTALNGGEVIQETEENKKIQGRRLNVELTAGGGGNTKGRRDKIREKNSKLKEERARRKLEEKQVLQDKLKKRREQSEKEKAKKSKKGPTGANAEAMRDSRGVHPSRLNRVPQAA